MKYLVILTDGMADYPCPEINQSTPLMHAHTPNMDALAHTSQIGLVKSVPDGLKPGSDVANLSIMGYDPQQYYTGRSPLEAVSMGVAMTPQDLSLRCNLVTLSDESEYFNKTMLDYSAGEISSAEATELIQAIEENMGTEMFHFYAGISYRHLLLWQNGLGHKLQLTAPHDISGQQISNFLPQGDGADQLLTFMQQSFEILAKHPINQKRIAAGKPPANSIWLWGEGSVPLLPNFQEKYQLSGAVVAAVDLIKGIGQCAGMEVLEVEGATGGIHTNFAGKIEAALQALKKGTDYVFVHIESADEAGHQGVLETKIWSIEQIDQLVIGRIREALADFDELKVLITPDHPTPVHLKTHVSDPVPFMVFEANHPYQPDENRVYDEATAKASGLFISPGHSLMDYFIKGL